jgi:hypothetical protein
MTHSDAGHERSANSSSDSESAKPGLTGSILIALRRAWRPTPPNPPRIDPDLTSLSALPRVTEALRYSILDLERAISPNGGLRAWAQLNVLVALVLAIPAFLVVPVVTLLLSGFATWSEFLKQIFVNLLVAAVAIFLAVLVLVLAGRVIEAELRRHRGRRRP